MSVGATLDMDLPAPCDRVDVTLARFTPTQAIATGYDASGAPVAMAVTSGPKNAAEHLLLVRPGIARVVVEAPDQETLLLGVCCLGKRPRIQSITKREKSVILKWSATPGQNYRVQFKPKLATGDWTDLGGDVTATGVSAAKVDDSFGGAAQRFYRVVELP